VTVQVPLAFDASVVGLHCREETVVVVDATNDTANVCAVPLAVAVIVAV
jgi:hypothetical protein